MGLGEKGNYTNSILAGIKQPWTTKRARLATGSIKDSYTSSLCTVFAVIASLVNKVSPLYTFPGMFGVFGQYGPRLTVRKRCNI